MEVKSGKNILKDKFLKYLGERKPCVEPWTAKLIVEIEKREQQIEIKGSQLLPNKDF